MLTEHKRFNIVTDVLEDTRRLISDPANWKRGTFNRNNAWSIDTAIEKSRNDNKDYQTSSFNDQRHVSAGIDFITGNVLARDPFEGPQIKRQLELKILKQRIYRSYNKGSRLEYSFDAPFDYLNYHYAIVAWNDYSTHDEVIILLEEFIKEAKSFAEHNNPKQNEISAYTNLKTGVSNSEQIASI